MRFRLQIYKKHTLFCLFFVILGLSGALSIARAAGVPNISGYDSCVQAARATLQYPMVGASGGPVQAINQTEVDTAIDNCLDTNNVRIETQFNGWRDYLDNAILSLFGSSPQENYLEALRDSNAYLEKAKQRLADGKINQAQYDKLVAFANKSNESYKGTAASLLIQDNGQPNDIANYIGWILYWLASFFSKVVGWMMAALVYVASYNNFLNHRIVITGWQIIRDICNNFFIVGLLVISVATILRQPASYQYQQALGKLLVMAVLINFSKLFTGVLIDVSQVITIYFANALAGSGEAVILYALGLYNLYQAVETYGGQAAFDAYGSAIYALLYALILSVIAAVVVTCIVVVLVYRIVTLWFLVILSPAAFLAKAIPGQEKYFSEWMSTLSKELLVAPVMLFFLYLSLFAGAVDTTNNQNINGATPNVNGVVGQSQAQTAQQLKSNMNSNPGGNTSPVKIIDFLMIIGLLVGSLVAGQRVGAKGSSWAGAGVAKLDGWRKKGANFAKAVPSAVGQAVDDKLGFRAGVARTLSNQTQRIPFVGRALNGAAAGYSAGTAKREQEAISNRAAALRVDQMTEDEKRALAARSGDRYGRIAAIQSLIQNGQIRDDAQGPERARDLALINQARTAMATSPELQAKLDDSLRKYMPSMAAASTMYTNNGQVDIARLESDMRTGKMDMSKMMAGITDPRSPEFTRLQTSIAARMGGNADDAFARFTMRVANNDEKEMGKIFSAMSDEVKNEVTRDISQASFQAPGAVATAITPAEVKNRDAFLKASGAFNRLQDAFVDDADRDNWVKENGELIASKATVGQIGDIVASVGHALDPKQIEKLKGRSKAFESAVQGAFSTLADSLDPAMLTAGHPDFDRAKSVYQNALLGGGTINLNRRDGNDVLRQGMIDTVMQGKKKEDILKNMHSNNINEHFIRATANTLSGKDIEKLTERSAQDKAQTRTALSAAVASLDAATITTPATASIARNIMRNAAASGATFNTSGGAPGSDAAARRTMFGADVVSKLSAGDLKNANLDSTQIGVLARFGNISALKSFFVDPGNNIQLAQDLAAAIRPMAAGTPPQRDRYDKLKDFL